MGRTWAQICADLALADLSFKIESDRWGNVVMSPPAGANHSDYQSEMLIALLRLLPEGLASSVSWSSCRVETDQFNAGIGGGKTPVDFLGGGVACGLPSGASRASASWPGTQRRKPWRASTESSILGQVQPASRFGRVVDFQFAGQAARLGGRKRFVQAGARVGGGLVHDQHERAIWSASAMPWSLRPSSARSSARAHRWQRPAWLPSVIVARRFSRSAGVNLTG